MGKKIFFLVIILFTIITSFSQNISIQGGGTGSTTADALVSNLVGQGVSYSNAAFTVGSGGQSTGLSAGTTALNNGYFSTGSSAIGISSGIILSSGNIYNAPGPNQYVDITYDWASNGDADINALVLPYGTHDACGLEFDFIPQSDVISFRYVFASEEYPEYVGSAYNDAFAFFVSSLEADGLNYVNQNIALIPGTPTPVTINNVNSGANSQYYSDNSGGSNLEYDGKTTVLTASITVVPCRLYHMKMIVTDVADGLFDSSVFLESGSFTSPSISGFDITFSQPSAGGNSNAVEGCSDAIITLNMSGTSLQPRKVPFYLSGTAGFGTDYSTVPDITSTFNTTFPGQYYVTIPAGSTSASLQIVPVGDVPIEITENVHISVQMNSCSGTSYQDGDIYILDNSDPMTISSSIDTNICFGANTNISCNVTSGQFPFTYTWDPAGNNAATINVTPATDQMYHVTVTDACGAARADSIFVGVYPLPAASLSGSDTICRNATDSVPLTITLSGAPPWDVTVNNGSNNINFNGVMVSPVIFYVLDTVTTTYTVTSVSDIHCAGDSPGTPVTITVQPVPSATMSGPTQLCNTGAQLDSISFTLTGTAPWTIYYSIDSLIFDTISGITNSPCYLPVAPAQTTTYYLVAMNDAYCNGTVSGTSLIIKLNDPPFVNLGPDTLSCSGNFTLLAGNPGSTFLWNTNAVTDSIIADTSGIYSVTVTNVFGCSGTDSILVTFGSNPVISLGNDTTVCSGTAITLHAGIIQGAVYNWYPSGNADSLVALQSGMYSVTVTDTTGCFSADTINIAYSSLPGVNLGTDSTVCTGFHVLHAGNPGATYLWNTNDTTEFIMINYSDTFSVTVTNVTGCSNSDTVNITIGNSPVINLGNDTAICNGTPITLHAGVFPNVTYLWSPSGNTESITVTQTGTYTVTVTDSLGCAGIGSINILSDSGFVVNLGVDTILCSGASLTIHAGPGSSYYWNTMATSEYITVINTGIYSVTVTNANNCFDTDSISVAISNLQQGQITGDTLVCEGYTGNYQVQQSSGHSYNWTVTGGIAPSSTVNPISVIWGSAGTGSLVMTETDTSTGCSVTTTVYPVTIIAKPVPSITGDQFACAGSNGQYATTAQNGYTYNWFVNGGSVTSGSNSAAITVAWGDGTVNPGEVSITEDIVNAHGCTISSSVFNTMIFTQTPDLQIHDPGAVCFPQTIDLTAASITSGSTGINGLNYWKDSLKIDTVAFPGATSATGTYYISAYNSCGEVIKPVHVVINDTLPVIITHDPAPECYPEGADLTAAAVTAGSIQASGFQYWTDSLATIPLLFPDSVATQGRYYISGANACGSGKAPVYVSIHPALPVLVIDHPDSTCAPFHVDITDSLITAGSANVFVLSYWNDSLSANPLASPMDISTSGVYYIKAGNACGSVIKPVVVFINPRELNIVLKITDASCSDGVDGKAETAVTGGHEPYSYSWNTSPVQTTPVISSLASGSYIITVSDVKGCSVIDTAVVTEINTDCLVIPSAFTPNKDNNNDTWEFKNISLYPDTKVEVYSRWGTLVFKSNDYRQGAWDGTYNGNDIPSGSYVYIIRQNNGYEPIQGTITIIR